jgi:hypothetical protein
MCHIMEFIFGKFCIHDFFNKFEVITSMEIFKIY